MPGPVRADQIKLRSVDWLWRELIPRGMITTVGGRAEQGKGLFIAYLAAYVSNKRIKEADGSTRWGRALYSAVEDSHESMTAPRLQAVGARMENVHVWDFILPTQMLELESIIRSEQIDLLAIDPFAAHLTGGVSRHSESIRSVLTPLKVLAEEVGTAIVIVEHVLKRVSPNSYPIAAIGGSGSGLPAASRMAFLFGENPDDDDCRILACVKHNIRDDPKAISFQIDTTHLDEVGEVPFLIYDGECDFDPMRLVTKDRNGRVGRPPDKREAAAEWLIKYLWRAHQAGREVKSGMVFEDAKHHGMSSKTLRRAAEDIKVVKTPPGGGRNVVWTLADATLAACGEDLPDPSAIPPPPEPKTETDWDLGLQALLGGAPPAPTEPEPEDGEEDEDA